MSGTVFLVVLLAAALHAGWNAVVKGASDKQLTTVLIAGTAAALALPLLPFLPVPARESWPFLAASTLLQVTYLWLVSQAYRLADMSQAYPLMRGTAPLIVAMVGTLLLAEPLPPLAWAGIGVISTGILSMVAAGRAGQGRGMAFALANALVIASYTLVDGEGVRRSGAPVAYTLWLALTTGVPVVAWAALRRRTAFGAYARANWHFGLVGGIGTTAAYGLSLWAMTHAPVAMVAALRESSILFGVLISALILHEKVGRTRVLAAGVIAAGVAVLRLA